MVLIESNERPQRVQADSSTRKIKRTRLIPIVVCLVLMVIMVTKKTSSYFVDADTALIQDNTTLMLLNALLPDLIKIVSRQPQFPAELRQKRRRTAVTRNKYFAYTCSIDDDWKSGRFEIPEQPQPQPQQQQQLFHLFSQPQRQFQFESYQPQTQFLHEPQLQEQPLPHPQFQFQFEPQLQSQFQPQSERQQQPQPHLPTKMLKFVGALKEEIYTNRELTHENVQHLEVQLIDTETGQMCTDSLPLKVEIVVLRGDFPPDHRHAWTSDEFKKNIVTARRQRRPLIVGKKHQLVKKLKNGRAFFKDLMITDVSKNFDCQTFKLGAQIVQSANFPRILEACTDEDFRVKERRGEKNKKHKTPSLDDEVWRLINIAKKGKFHQIMLSFKNRQEVPSPIKTVGDFLNMLRTDPDHLKSTLDMKGKWQKTVEHAERANLVRGETSLHNSVRNETESNLAPQVSAPILYPIHQTQETPQAPQNLGVSQTSNPQTNLPFGYMESSLANLTNNQGRAPQVSAQALHPIHWTHENPLENMGVSQTWNPQTNLPFDHMHSSPANLTNSQGRAMNHFVRGESSGSIFYSRRYETDANLCSTSYSACFVTPDSIPPGNNMGIPGQFDPQAHSRFDQMNCNSLPQYPLSTVDKTYYPSQNTNMRQQVDQHANFQDNIALISNEGRNPGFNTANASFSLIPSPQELLWTNLGVQVNQLEGGDNPATEWMDSSTWTSLD